MDLYSFLASDKRFNPDQDRIKKSEIVDAYMKMTPEDVIEDLYLFNNFLGDLSEVFRKERDRK